jgi:hypothetical protein
MLLMLRHVIIFFRLRAWQGVLPIPNAAVAPDHLEPLCVAVWNEYKESKPFERN